MIVCLAVDQAEGDCLRTAAVAIYRKPDGSTVNVTRMSFEKEVGAAYRNDENYVGEVIQSEDGGCVRAQTRVAGITG